MQFGFLHRSRVNNPACMGMNRHINATQNRIANVVCEDVHRELRCKAVVENWFHLCGKIVEKMLH
jgi:hypothetical protein